MPIYRIELLRPDGSLLEERRLEFENDDDAIDHVGSIDHPHAMDVWQEGREVARFPPLRPPL